MSACVVIVPVLRRPHRVQPLLDSVNATVDARVLFVCTEDDTEERDAIAAAGGEFITLPGPHDRGDYARKINLAYRETSEPLLFLGADDLLFHPGWFERATDKLVGRMQVIGTNDLGNRRTMRGEHATHSLVTRDYIDRFGTIDRPGEVLHEGYWHEFVDDEFVQTAQARNRFVSAPLSHVEHLHPSWGKGLMDDLYEQQAMRMRAGRKVFERRRSLWMSPSLSPPTATTPGPT